MGLELRSVDELLLEEYVEPNWAVEEWLVEGESGLIVGEPKAFKSTLALDMAVSLATGEAFLGRYAVDSTVPVIYIQEENNMPIIMPQLYRLMQRAGRGHETFVKEGDELKKIWLPNPDVGPMDFQLSVRSGWKATKEDMKDVVAAANAAGAAYVFVDPLYKVNPGGLTHPDDVAPTLDTLSMIENETDASVVLIHHANKGNTTGGKRILGSQLIWAWGANNIYMTKAKKEGETYIKVEREFRGMPEPDDVRLYFEEDFHWIVENETYDSTGKPVGNRKSNGRNEFLMRAGNGDFDDMTQKQIAEIMGVSERTIRTWRKGE